MPSIFLSKSQTRQLRDWNVAFHKLILTEPRWEPLRKLYPMSLEEAAKIATSQTLHLKVLDSIYRQLDRSTGEFVIAAADEFIRQHLGVPRLTLVDDPDVVEAADTLSHLGHVSLPSVDAERVAEMRAYFEAQPVYPGSYVAGPERCTLDEARGGNFASFPLTAVFNCPHLVEIANTPETLAIVERFIGTTPTILGYSAWWSFAQPDHPIEAQLFHLDGDDYRFVKMFIYLTDVGEEDGPHTFFERTHDLDYLGAIRDGWPGGRREFENWLFGMLRKSDGQSKRALGAEPVELTGPRGTRFVANTFGVHKGQPPQKSDRLVCQVLYGITPRLQETIAPVKLGTAEASHFPPTLAHAPYDYINRLFLDPGEDG